MNKNKFWTIIETARSAAVDVKGMYEHILNNLAAHKPKDIALWQQIFDEYMIHADKQKLWGAASIMHNGCSDDGFANFRGWLIAQGKEVYLNALSNPDSLADIEAVRRFGREVLSLEYIPEDGYSAAASFEKIMYVASYAYVSRPDSVADIYSKMKEFPLSEEEKLSISSEIEYPPDIDTKWFDWDTHPSDTNKLLSQLHPNIYHIFNDPNKAYGNKGMLDYLA